MASTFTTNTGIEKIGDGEQTGLWGQTTNLNFDILDRALNSVAPIVLSGTTHTLTTSDGALSDGQFRVLLLGGSPSGTNTITVAPSTAQKQYFVKNTSGQDAVFTQGSGTTVTVPNEASAIIFCDGGGASANVGEIDFATSLADLGVTATAIQLNELGDFAALFTLPSADGTAGQTLVTDGSGVLSFATPASGSVSGPASSNNNHVAFFDGTTGQVIGEADSLEMFMNTVCLFKTDLSGVQIISGVGPSLSPAGFWGSNSVFIGNKKTGPGYEIGAQTVANGRQVGIGGDALTNSVGSTSFCGNTAIGAFSGNNVSTGNENTYLGFSAGATGAALRQTGSNNTFVGANTGNDAVFRLDLNLSASNRIIMGNNSITNAFIKVQWTVTSDARDKTDFEPLPQGLDVVDAIETYTFRFDNRYDYYVYDEDRNIIETPAADGSKKSDNLYVGYSAQQVKSVLDAAGFPPNVIVDTEDPENYKMKETALIPLLVNAIKELKARVEALEAAGV